MALGAAAKDPSWTLQAVCRYCVSRTVESSPLAGDDASRHAIATAVVHARMVRIAQMPAPALPRISCRTNRPVSTDTTCRRYQVVVDAAPARPGNVLRVDVIDASDPVDAQARRDRQPTRRSPRILQVNRRVTAIHVKRRQMSGREDLLMKLGEPERLSRLPTAHRPVGR